MAFVAASFNCFIFITNKNTHSLAPCGCVNRHLSGLLQYPVSSIQCLCVHVYPCASPFGSSLSFLARSTLLCLCGFYLICLALCLPACWLICFDFSCFVFSLAFWVFPPTHYCLLVLFSCLNLCLGWMITWMLASDSKSEWDIITLTVSWLKVLYRNGKVPQMHFPYLIFPKTNVRANQSPPADPFNQCPFHANKCPFGSVKPHSLWMSAPLGSPAQILIHIKVLAFIFNPTLPHTRKSLFPWPTAFPLRIV